jgi:hypothetical protein
MKYFILLSLTLLASCATNIDPAKRYCSDKGLDAFNTNISSYDGESEDNQYKMVELIKRVFKKNNPEVQSCYNQLNTVEDIPVCAIAIVKKGKITFLDVSNRENPLKPSFNKCLEEKFKKFDFSFLKNQEVVNIFQPITFSRELSF